MSGDVARTSSCKGWKNDVTKLQHEKINGQVISARDLGPGSLRRSLRYSTGSTRAWILVVVERQGAITPIQLRDGFDMPVMCPTSR